MPHHVKIEPVRLRGYNAVLDCDVRRTLAYRAVCSCGYRGTSRPSVAEARTQSLSHRRASA